MSLQPWMKRFLLIVFYGAFAWGGLMLLFMSLLFSFSACNQQCSLDNFGLLFLYYLQKAWPNCLITSIGFGLFVGVITEVQIRFLLPKITLKDNSPNKTPITTGLAITNPPSNAFFRWLQKSSIPVPWIVVVNGVSVASFKQGDNTIIPLEAGNYKVFVGFENHKQAWKKGCRSQTLDITIHPGEITLSKLYFNYSEIIRTQTISLILLLNLVFEKAWVLPLLNLIPDSYWDTHPELVSVIKTLLPFHPVSTIAILIFGVVCFIRMYLQNGSMIKFELQ